MAEQTLSLSQKILHTWNKLSAFPGGKILFNWIIARYIPYSASIGASVLKLQPGFAKLKLTDKRRVRNHLNSIHAIALTNLGELTSGLALNAGLSGDVRGIVTSITTEYLKKARGELIAESNCTIPEVRDDMNYTVEAYIRDHSLDVVAKVTVNWRLGCNKTS